MTPSAFASALIVRGIEVHVRGNRLWLWPARAYTELLTAEDRDSIRVHREGLKALVRAGLAPRLPEDTDDSTPATASTTPLPVERVPVAVPPCPYCGRACIGPEHVAYATVHFHDPAEVERRAADATAVMRRMVGRVSPY